MRTRLTLLFTIVASLLFALALFKGYTRGGQDFRVFDHAARLALEGKWDALYWEGPDRFLYAPGFAILFSPLSLFPVAVTHAVWLALTTVFFFLAMRLLSRYLGALPVLIGILFSMRAIWIDLRYGQVNLLILSSALWALLTFVNRETRSRELAVSWFFFGLAIVSKLYPFALLAFPALTLISPSVPTEGRKRGLIAVSAAVAGAALVLILPSIFSHGSGSFLFSEWMGALSRKGFPTDTHNQSLLAFLFRMFSGETFFSLSLGDTPLRSPLHFLNTSEIRAIWLLFSLGVALLFVRAAKRVREAEPLLQVALGIALCFLPAHLMWKSYFLMGIPLVAVLAAKGKFRELGVLALIVPFSSNTFVGPTGAAWLEAASLFFWVHLSVLGLAYFSSRKPLALTKALSTRQVWVSPPGTA